MTATPGNFMTKHWSIDMARREAGNVSVNRVDLEWLARTAALVDLETIERRADLTNTILSHSASHSDTPGVPLDDLRAALLDKDMTAANRCSMALKIIDGWPTR